MKSSNVWSENFSHAVMGKRSYWVDFSRPLTKIEMEVDDVDPCFKMRPTRAVRAIWQLNLMTLTSAHLYDLTKDVLPYSRLT